MFDLTPCESLDDAEAIGYAATGSFQSDGPDSPTSLTITSFPTFMQFAVGLPSYLPAGAVVEIWEYTASTPFGSATKIAEARSSLLEIPKRDTTGRYYWARIRDQKGALSGTFPASVGQSGAADFVQTGDVAPNGVTDVLASVTASTDVYTSGTTPILVDSLVVGSYPYDTEMIVTASGAVDHNLAAGFQSNTYLQIRDSTTSSTIGAPETVIARNANTTDTRAQQSFTREVAYSVPASTSKTFYLYGQGASISAPGSQCLILNTTFKVEVLKR